MMDDDTLDNETPLMEERPLTSCPECSGEIDLTFASEGQTITCVVCGSDLFVVSLEPPEVEILTT